MGKLTMRDSTRHKRNNDTLDKASVIIANEYNSAINMVSPENDPSTTYLPIMEQSEIQLTEKEFDNTELNNLKVQIEEFKIELSSFRYSLRNLSTEISKSFKHALDSQKELEKCINEKPVSKCECKCEKYNDRDLKSELYALDRKLDSADDEIAFLKADINEVKKNSIKKSLLYAILGGLVAHLLTTFI